MLNKVLVVYYTNKGEDLSKKLTELSETVNFFDGRKKRTEDFIGDFFKKYQHIVFISSTGIAVRCIAPYLRTKYLDPSVTVISDDGRFTIPLSGSHLSGGLHTAERIAEIFKNTLVTTTATDNMKIVTPDRIAYREDYKVVNPELLRHINSGLINGLEISEDLNKKAHGYVVQRNSYNEILNCIKDFLDEEKDISMKERKSRVSKSLFIVKNPVCVGIGCRKGKTMEEILNFLQDVLKEKGIHKEDIKYIGTCEAKINERAINELSFELKARLIVHENSEIENVQDRFEKSDFVKETIGVYNVSSSSAYLVYRNLILEKEKKEGITLSLSRKI